MDLCELGVSLVYVMRPSLSEDLKTKQNQTSVKTDTERNYLLTFYFKQSLKIFIAVTKHHGQKQLEEKRVYLSLQFHITVLHWGSQGRI